MKLEAELTTPVTMEIVKMIKRRLEWDNAVISMLIEESLNTDQLTSRIITLPSDIKWFANYSSFLIVLMRDACRCIVMGAIQECSQNNQMFCLQTNFPIRHLPALNMIHFTCDH